ncbi:hypothetical protein PDE_06620 [Penicillium oxalicum 114-2]|uniref:Uncharacterized protein n=1 Tax=Penicillium oxalicum (strain 114-2 / CGMCC 5302) TaxID=933388 RepID=S8AZ03_PENO1|nr:hypothetical protein PDE_06620 [Penicillium oxalicum 114-2]
MPLFHRDSTASSSSGRGYEEPHETRSHSGLFSSRSSHSTRTSVSSGSASSTNHSRRHSLLHRSHEDPSIMAAREQVLRAEHAEREADKALLASRKAVKEARDHVKHLEREAAEEARLARIKQDQAKSISKRAKPLGRHI